MATHFRLMWDALDYGHEARRHLAASDASLPTNYGAKRVKAGAVRSLQRATVLPCTFQPTERGNQA